MAVVCALQPIPNQGAHTREDLLSMALEGCFTMKKARRSGLFAGQTRQVSAGGGGR